MIEITLIEKYRVDSKTERKEKETIEIERPNKYEELEKIIRKKFNLADKKIAIEGITFDDDEILINDEESYNEKENKKIKKFNVIIIGIEGDEEDLDELNIDEILNIDNELKIYENEFLDLIKKEINNESNNEDFLIKEEKEKTEKDDFQNISFNNFKKEISLIYEKNKKNFLESIESEFISIDNYINKVKNNLRLGGDVDQINDLANFLPSIDIVADKDEKIVKLSIDCEKKDHEIFEDQANDINIKGIIIKNLSNSELTNMNFHWEKDKDSNKDIDIPGDKKEIKIKDFGINEEKRTDINLIIRNPKINENYFFKFYIFNNANENITENPCFINIKINNNGGLKKEEMERLYEELNNSYYLEGIITEEEMYQKIREYNGDKNKLIEFIESIM